MAVTIQPTKTLSAGSTEIFSLDCQRWLDSGEIIADVSATADTGLTVSNAAVNSSAKVIDGVQSPANQSVSMKVVTAASASGALNVTVTLTTDSSPARVVPFKLPVNVV